MDELLELIQRIGTDDPPTNEELQAAREELVEALRAATAPESIDLEAARSLRSAVDAVDREVHRREEEEAAQRDEAEQLRAGLDDDEGDEEEGGDEAEASDETPPADADGTGADAQQDEAEPVAAGAGQPWDKVGAALARVRSRPTVRPDASPQVRVLVNGPALGGDVPGNLDQAADLFYRHAHQISRGKQSMIQLQKAFPEPRTMTASAAANTLLLDGTLDQRALVAAGGICEPLPADFTHPICGDRSRPIRDATPNFGATRGGVRFAPSATIADLAGAVTIWTHDHDVDPEAGAGAEPPTGPAEKPCPRVDCEEEVEVRVDAVTACLTVGNYQVRFNPEFWRARLDLLMVLHDRIAEQTMFATMQDAATATTTPSVDDNTAQTLFLALDRAAAALRSRHRIETIALRWVAPSWLRDAIRASIARQGGGSFVENLSLADAVIDTFFSSRSIRPIWSPDLQVFGPQAAGELESWPDDQAVTLLYPEGTFFFLDGGTIDLGTEITDSTLNATNDRQAFLETFEQVAFRGCEALQITVPVGEDCVCVGPEAAAA